jgi:hypothetical protein
MSMIGHVRQITPDDLRELQDNPSTVRKLLRRNIGASTEDMVSALRRVQKIALARKDSRVLETHTDREKARAQILKELQSVGVTLPGEDPGGESLSLEKSWHSLHYLLTGKAEEAPSPLGNVILGGTPIGDDVGYGSARFLTPEQVREVSSALNAVTADDLKARFDADQMSAAHIYACDGEEIELVLYYFANLTRYYNDAATKGNAMLLYID